MPRFLIGDSNGQTYSSISYCPNCNIVTPSISMDSKSSVCKECGCLKGLIDGVKDG